MRNLNYLLLVAGENQTPVHFPVLAVARESNNSFPDKEFVDDGSFALLQEGLNPVQFPLGGHQGDARS